MIRVISVWFALSVGAWAQLRYLTPVKSKKERVVFFVLMGLFGVVSTTLILDIDLPNPMSGIRGLFEPFGRSILH